MRVERPRYNLRTTPLSSSSKGLVTFFSPPPETMATKPGGNLLGTFVDFLKNLISPPSLKIVNVKNPNRRTSVRENLFRLNAWRQKHNLLPIHSVKQVLTIPFKEPK